eukprot:TRINITY_DN8811_c0_g1_i1.p1 TRINITY_DN8811_c0_g1~~TRINITY_DN8811_c0_g1_i1.p1  ORF type:complete len:108 (+),score=6.72 TRINITY_DN8811_c0_g1_i1:52-375(+)
MDASCINMMGDDISWCVMITAWPAVGCECGAGVWNAGEWQCRLGPVVHSARPSWAAANLHPSTQHLHPSIKAEEGKQVSVGKACSLPGARSGYGWVVIELRVSTGWA